MEVAKPIIHLIDDSVVGMKSLNDYLELNDRESELIKKYPTVYIHNWDNNGKYDVYVGESNDFFQRTSEHYDMIDVTGSWQKNIKTKKAKLYVIAHPEFNKSMTLDVENKLIHYLIGSDSVNKVHNARGNPQNEYFPCEDFDKIFSKIWHSLRKINNSLFMSESEIKNSAIYKASPLHKLRPEQLAAKDKIIDKISECLLKEKEHQLVFVEGEAGTGKTVLMSSIFYDLVNKSRYDVDDDNLIYKDLDCALVVNHDEQLVVYDDIVNKLDLVKKGEQIVFNPTTLINQFKDKKNSPIKRKKIYDVIFVDESHLLLTQNNQSFTDKNQLDELLRYAKVVVAMFDKKQVLSIKQYKNNDLIDRYRSMADDNNSHLELKEQLRMNCNKEVQKWIKDFVNDGKIGKLTRNRGKYEVKVFDNPYELEKAIKSKAKNENSKLSRLVATYDWPYNLDKACNIDKYWCVNIDNKWKMPWNGEYKRFFTAKEKRGIKGLAWAEQPQTIDEVGSTFTIQGFDLNYVGVIIGKSFGIKDGKLDIRPKNSFNKNATNNRTLEDGSKINISEELLKNELGVLMTRGVNGLYIFAEDPELRNYLKKCI